MEMRITEKKVSKAKGKDNTPKYMLIASVGSSFKNWIKLLWINRFDIDLRHIPYVLLITFLSIVFFPVMMLEKLIFYKRINAITLKEPVFIIGPMRSGTTFLHYLLSKDKQYAWLRTAETIFPRIYLLLDPLVNFLVHKFLPKKRPMDNLPIDIDCPQEEEFGMANLCVYSPYNGAYFPKKLSEFYYKYSFFKNVNNKIIEKWKKTYFYFLKKISYSNDNKRLLSKSIVNPGRLRYIIEMFPDAKFIFMYRNPYKLILSSKKLFARNVLPHMAYHQITEEQLVDSILDIAKNCFLTYHKDRDLIKPENLIEIKFEDFVRTPLAFLKEIYTKLNIDGFEDSKEAFIDYIKTFKNYQADSYNIAPALEEKIYTTLQFVFERYDYRRYDL